jgi:hypothetical protein
VLPAPPLSPFWSLSLSLSLSLTMIPFPFLFLIPFPSPVRSCFLALSLRMFPFHSLFLSMSAALFLPPFRSLVLSLRLFPFYSLFLSTALIMSLTMFKFRSFSAVLSTVLIRATDRVRSLVPPMSGFGAGPRRHTRPFRLLLRTGIEPGPEPKPPRDPPAVVLAAHTSHKAPHSVGPGL